MHLRKSWGEKEKVGTRVRDRETQGTESKTKTEVPLITPAHLLSCL